jgi:hypothetical protein
MKELVLEKKKLALKDTKNGLCPFRRIHYESKK